MCEPNFKCELKLNLILMHKLKKLIIHATEIKEEEEEEEKKKN